MQVHGLGATTEDDNFVEPNAFEDEILENEDQNNVPDQDSKWDDYNWQTDRLEYNITSEDIRNVPKWHKDAKAAGITRDINNYDNIDAANLNKKQRIGYDYVMSHINKKISDPNNTKPLYLDVSGRAGTGKTYFANCIAKEANKHVAQFMVKAAPTGTAAFLIGGHTLHSLFAIPTQRTSTKQEIRNLPAERLRDMQKDFKDVQLLLIDEKSMVGLYMLYMIDKRLRELKPEAADQPFGGISVILMGDFAQLEPVKDQPLYAKKKDITPMQEEGRLLFQLFDTTIIFDQQMRQVGEEEQQFIELLIRVANGETTKEDWELLKTRELTGDGQIPPEEQEYIWKHGRKICARNKDTIAYNQQRIRDLDQAIAKINSENKPNTVEQRILTRSQANGIPPNVWLAKGSKVQLTVNEFSDAGLTNGTIGTTIGTIYEENCKPPDIPSMVLVHFPAYIGKMSYKGMEGCWPIIAREQQWFGKRGQRMWRRGLSLTAAYSNTIHASQGASISEPVIICLEASREFAEGLIYTSLSRVRKFSQLSFYPKVPDYIKWFKNMKKRPKFRDRLEHEKKQRESDANFFANFD